MASKLKAKDPVAAEPSKPKILVYGKSGVGKTWCSTEFPSVYYIDTEGGANLGHYTARLAAGGGVYLGPDEGACDFAVILDQVKALGTETHSYRTLVIDSISKVFNTAVAEEAERLASANQKNEFGADRKAPVAWLRKLVMWLDRLDMNVILIAHEKPEWGMVNGQRAEVGATFDCWDKLEYELHLALRVQKQGKSRKAFVRKSRLEGFPEGESFDWSYAEFAQRYGKDVVERAAKVVTLATPEQVAEMERLLESIKVPDDWIAKVFTKAKAESWQEVESAQMVKTIEFLKGKIAA